MSFGVHEYYDWNALIEQRSRERMINDIELGIKAGKFWHNSPKYQTNWNVFGTPSQDWINLKMSFIWSCFSFLNKEVSIKQIQSWAFQTCLPGEERDKLWHHHNHNNQTTTVSGVYYLHLPEDVTSYETAGTELAPNGVEGDGKFITTWKTGHWMIYPGKVWHRPGILQSKNNRFIVAADMEF
mgnify:FL=1